MVHLSNKKTKCWVATESDNKHVTNLYFLERENTTKEAPALKWKC